MNVKKNSMKIITVCGSLKYYKEMLEVSELMQSKGYCMLIPVYNYFSVSKEKISDEKKIMFDKIHKEKIKLSDAILVMNIDGYIGESTKSEIDFATSLNKEIIYYSDIKD